MLQRFYLNEVIRGKVDIGTYTLREEHENEKLDASQIIFESVCRPEDIIDAIKTGNIKNTGLLQEDENRYSGNSKMLKAKEIINLDAKLATTIEKRYLMLKSKALKPLWMTGDGDLQVVD